MANTLYFNDGSHEVIFGDELEAMRRIIYEKLGSDAEAMFNDIVSTFKGEYGDGDDYERIADGYRNMLVDVMNDLHEALSQPRLNRKRLERIHRNLDRNL